MEEPDLSAGLPDGWTRSDIDALTVSGLVLAFMVSLATFAQMGR